ncbi:MAG: PilZ domain-containing protein [Spirochaetota bacterium]
MSNSNFLKRLVNYLFPVSFANLPNRLLVLGLVFIMIPIISYVMTAFNSTSKDYSLTDVKGRQKILHSFVISKERVNKNYPFTKGSRILEFPFRYYKIILNGMAVVIGFGLLMVRRWAYFLFLFFMSFLTVHAISMLFISGFGEKMIWNFFITLLYFTAFQYFLSKDISTPYLTLVPRSFRKKWRVEIPITGTIQQGDGSLALTTIDISPSGCLAKIEEGIDHVKKRVVTLDLDSKWEVEANVVRNGAGQVGLHFNYVGLRDPLKKKLKSYLESKLLPRFAKDLPAKVDLDGKEFSGMITNISEGGFFFSSQSFPKLEDKVTFQFVLFGITFRGKGSVSWVNETAQFNKPLGFGVSFLELSHTVTYSFFIFLIRRFYSVDSRDR